MLTEKEWCAMRDSIKAKLSQSWIFGTTSDTGNDKHNRTVHKKYRVGVLVHSEHMLSTDRAQTEHRLSTG